MTGAKTSGAFIINAFPSASDRLKQAQGASPSEIGSPEPQNTRLTNN